MAERVMPRGGGGEAYPGQSLGLPASGRGSLAPWQIRFVALVLDWAVSMTVAVGFFGPAVLFGHGWRSYMILAVYFVESAVLTTVAGGSFGALLARIAVVRLDGRPLGLVRGVLRAALVCLVLPVLVVGPDQRGLHDVAIGTAVIRRR